MKKFLSNIAVSILLAILFSGGNTALATTATIKSLPPKVTTKTATHNQKSKISTQRVNFPKSAATANKGHASLRKVKKVQQASVARKFAAPRKTNTVSVARKAGKKSPYEQVNFSNNAGLAFLAIDAESGKIIFSRNADTARYPASLTKLMTLYLLFEKLKLGMISFDTKIFFSDKASSMPRSKLGAKTGEWITIKEAIDSLIILSANDVAVAVSEKLAGSEENFTLLMNAKARDLAMGDTNFQNASGLFHSNQKSNAIDMVRLAVAIRRDFPNYYRFFSQTNFNFRGRLLNGHNGITRNYPGAEGFKTGFISQSGFNVVSSAKQNDRTIIAAVLGGKTAGERDAYMHKLLDNSFLKVNHTLLVHPNNQIPIQIHETQTKSSQSSIHNASYKVMKVRNRIAQKKMN